MKREKEKNNEHIFKKILLYFYTNGVIFSGIFSFKNIRHYYIGNKLVSELILIPTNNNVVRW